MAATYKMPKNVTKAIGHVAEVLTLTGTHPDGDENAKSHLDIVKDIQIKLSTKMDSKFTVLEKKLTLPSPTQKQLESTAKELGKAAECIKASTNDIGNSIAQVTDTSSQLANTATNYKDALLKSNEQQAPSWVSKNNSQIDPKILRDVERKSCQILIDTLNPKIMEMSLAGIKEKVSTVLKEITNPPPSKDTTVTEVIKL